MHGKKHPVKYSHAQTWGAWSEWKWDPNAGRYYAERFDRQGNVDYAWDDSTTTGNVHQHIPRTEASIDQLTAGIGGLDVNTSSYHDQGVVYPNQNSSSVHNSTLDIPESPQYTHDTSYNDHLGYSHSYGDKGKGIATPTHIDYDGGLGRLGPIPPTTGTYSQYDYTQQPSLVVGQDDRGRTPTASFLRNNLEDTSNSYYSQSSHGSADEELEQALKSSREELLGNGDIGGPSNSGDPYDSGSIYNATYDLNSIDPPERQTTPTPTRPDFIDTSIIRGTPGNVEPVDHRFVVENSYKFQPGEIFKILWSEPAGQVPGGTTAPASISDIRAVNDSAGQFYSHHSTCVPILTYDRRGCGKRGVKPSKHGIIFAVGQKPRLLRDEPELGFAPVPLEMYAEGETLAKESRVNYSKLVTIEHNVKVFFIGRIPYSHFNRVQDAVNKCWDDKMHKSSRKSRR
ncbi:hypothetical protein GGS24DRAFT_513472 [Hypoxylon argillaceum]|nr:hypothetical protein GGS24DRAFT_513472 [Hypoxylon argillaceum]KAI1145745.1 hypothetical protein F4825DRAFT_467088 [Nemania diffusa]